MIIIGISKLGQPSPIIYLTQRIEKCKKKRNCKKKACYYTV